MIRLRNLIIDRPCPAGFVLRVAYGACDITPEYGDFKILDNSLACVFP